jgi:hypothetical protein
MGATKSFMSVTGEAPGIKCLCTSQHKTYSFSRWFPGNQYFRTFTGNKPKISPFVIKIFQKKRGHRLTKFVPGCSVLTGTWPGRVAYSAKPLQRVSVRVPDRDEPNVCANVQCVGRPDRRRRHPLVDSIFTIRAAQIAWSERLLAFTEFGTNTSPHQRLGENLIARSKTTSATSAPVLVAASR